MTDDQYRLETYKSLIAISTEGYKLLIIINGGAIISILTFLGQMTVRSIPVPNIGSSLYALIVGLLMCGISVFFGYITQLSLINKKGKWSNFFLNIAMLSYLASLVCFAYGCYKAIDILEKIH